MEYISFNKELSVCNILLKRLFNNISVYRDNKKVKFNCVIGNRSRIFKNRENPTKKGIFKLPMIIITRTGVNKNSDRISNLNNEVKYRTNGSNPLDYNLYSPVPVDLTYTVTIVSKYQEDIDMALSNFIPFFNKDLYVQCVHPKFSNLVFQSQVVMEDVITEEHPEDLDPTEDDLVTCTCTFLFKTYIFCGNEQASGTYTKRSLSTYISSVISTYYDPELSTEISTYVDQEISVITDTVYNGFIPDIRKIYFGLYPVPTLSAYDPHLDWVDNLSSEEEKEPWVDKIVWKIDETSVSYYNEETYQEEISVISSYVQEGNEWEWQNPLSVLTE